MNAEEGRTVFDLERLSKGFSTGAINRNEFVDSHKVSELKQLIRDADDEAAKLKSRYYRMAALADEVRAKLRDLGSPKR